MCRIMREKRMKIHFRMGVLYDNATKVGKVFFFFSFPQEIQKTGSRLLLAACDVLRVSPQFGAGSRTGVLNTLSWERSEVVELPEEGAQRKLGNQTCHYFTFINAGALSENIYFQ